MGSKQVTWVASCLTSSHLVYYVRSNCKVEQLFKEKKEQHTKKEQNFYIFPFEFMYYHSVAFIFEHMEF